MKFFNKNVHYFKFFEDIKIIEIDDDNNRLAIVFNGKESIINIFDASPYVNYCPIEEKNEDIDLSVKGANSCEDMEPGEKLNKTDIQDVDISKMFAQIQLNKSMLLPNHLNLTIINENNQHCVIYSNSMIQDNNSQSDKKSLKRKMNLLKSNLASLFEINRFSHKFLSEKKEKKVLLSLKKPKIKTKILSVISSFYSPIINIKWFTFPSTSNKNNSLSKLLLAICDDGYISISKLKKIDNTNRTKINNRELQGQPMSKYPEEWYTIASTNLQVPIIDFYLLLFPDSDKKYIRLFTLHIDNNIIFWVLLEEKNCIKFTPAFTVGFDPSLPIKNILISKNEQLLYAFNSKGIEIFIIGKTPPFPKLYSYFYDEDYSTPIDKKELFNDEFSGEIDEEIISLGKNFYIEDAKYLKNIIKPKFVCCERRIIIQIYHKSKEKYKLLMFNCEGLMKAFDDIDFYRKCYKGEDKTLIYEIFQSDYNFSYCISPSLFYCNINKKEHQLNINNPIDNNNFLSHINQVILIQNEQENFFVTLPFSTPKAINDEQNIFSFSKSHEYKPIILWTRNNTILFTSSKKMFHMVKYCNDIDILGIPISEKKTEQYIIKQSKKD